MKIIRRKILNIFCKQLMVIYVVLTYISVLHAVQPTWEIDLSSVFDNREGDGKIQPSETYFFVTLAPEVGLKLTPNDRIAGGAVWNQPLQNGVKNGKIIPTIYYRHSGGKWDFSMGMFPMTQLREPLPGFLWCDSLAYFQQNLRGVLAQYEVPNGFMEAYIDWRGMQSETTREAFNIVFHGEWRPQRKSLLLGGHAMMNHLAKRKSSENEYVVDNFLINPYIGADLGKYTFADSLVIKGGALMTVERDRRHREWMSPAGFWLDLLFEWKFLGVRNSFYAGGKLFPLYSEFGNLLYQGEAYYQEPLYDRLDVYAHIYRNKYIDLEAQLNFNFTKRDFEFYQRLILNVEVGNLFESPHKAKRLR